VRVTFTLMDDDETALTGGADSCTILVTPGTSWRG
jgi:hypothetical protein